MYSSQKKRRVKPYARPTAFDINVQFDIRHFQRVKYGGVTDALYPSVSSDEAFNVKEGEILMSHTGPGVAKYRTHQVHCFSFANGLEVRGANSKANALEGLRYAGVAVTEFNPTRDVYEQGFVANVAGLNTLFNNGKDTIHPGDLVCADVPDNGKTNKHLNRALQGGVPREKLQFIIRPYNKMAQEYGEDLARRFIIGTSVEYARAGNPVSLVLHHCNHVVRKGSAPASSSSSFASAPSRSSAASGSSKKSKKGKQ